MSVELGAIASAFMKWVWMPFTAIAGGIFIKQWVNTSESIKSLQGKVVALENKAVSDDRVREIVREELQPLMSDVLETKTNVKSIVDLVTQLRIEQAAHHAVQQYKESKDLN